MKSEVVVFFNHKFMVIANYKIDMILFVLQGG